MSRELVVGLVSSYREGRLAAGAIQSLAPAVDRIYVFEGPAGVDVPEVGEPSALPHPAAFGDTRLAFVHGEWGSDALKRTAMLDHVTHRHGGPVWGVWLDGDELLINGEWLRDYFAGAELRASITGAPRLVLVELDGSVAWAPCRCVRLDAIERFELGAHVIELKSGMVISLPNVPITKSEWWSGPRAEDPNLYVFPPLPGEPHILHRSILRPPERNELRLHERERQWFESRHPSLSE